MSTARLKSVLFGATTWGLLDSGLGAIAGSAAATIAGSPSAILTSTATVGSGLLGVVKGTIRGSGILSCLKTESTAQKDEEETPAQTAKEFAINCGSSMIEHIATSAVGSMIGYGILHQFEEAAFWTTVRQITIGGLATSPVAFPVIVLLGCCAAYGLKTCGVIGNSEQKENPTVEVPVIPEMKEVSIAVRRP